MDLPSTLQTTPKLPMQLGLPFDDLWSFVLFIACLSAAIGLVYLFCRQKFAERISAGTDDYPQQPRCAGRSSTQGS